jgi:hypothetical protein
VGPAAAARSSGLSGRLPAIEPAATPGGDSELNDDGANAPRRGLSRRRIALFAAIACVLALAVGLGVAVLAASSPPDRSSPNATVSGYYRALIAQNYADAWQYDANSRNQVSTQSDFIASLRSEDSQYGRVRSFTITQSENDSASHATVQVNVTRAGAGVPTTTYTVVLTQYDGATWLITSVTAG